MGITISGENNNDRILATDGVIDQLSGFNVVGVMTATSFTGDLTGDVTGNLTGNVTGNINNSTLLLQTGGSERIRITGNNEIGIAGANYGSAGQVLTSGGSGNAVTWSTITGTTINNNANNRLITGSGTANTLEGEATLTYNGTDTFELQPASATPAIFIGDSNRTGAGQGLAQFRGNWNGTTVARITFDAGDDTTNKDDGIIRFDTAPSGSLVERLRIRSDGNVDINGTPPWTVSGGNFRNLSISGEGQSASGFLWLGNGAATNNADFDLGRINFLNGGTIVARVIGTTDTSANDDGVLRFNTKKTGETEAERLRITSGGKISYNYDGSTVSSIADVDIRSNNGVHIRGVDANANNTNIYIGGAVGNQRKTAIIHDPVGGYCRGDLHFCLENSADLSDVDITDSKMVIKANGNIGIGDFGGSTVPQKLSVLGNMYMRQGDYITWNNGDCDISGISGYHLRFRTYDGSAMTEKMRITSNGYVTKPYHPVFSGRTNVQNGIVSGVGVIQFTADVNNGSHWSNSPNWEFTCPVAGFYYMASSTLHNGETYLQYQKQPSGGSYSNISTHSFAYTSGSLSYNQISSMHVEQCNAGDKLRFAVSGSGANYYGKDHGSATIFLIG